MKYRNIKTGAVIDINSELKGEDWEPVVAKSVKTVPKKSSGQKRKKQSKEVEAHD